MADVQVDAVYCPSKGMIACVLLQAAFGCNHAVPQFFDTADWLLAPCDGLVRMSATREQWRRVASMTRGERIERFARLKAEAEV